MKKLIIGLLLFAPFFAKAEVPANTFFFGDGKGYNVDGNQMYYCFGDGSCYSIEGTFAFVREVKNQLINLENRVSNLESNFMPNKNISGSAIIEKVNFFPAKMSEGGLSSNYFYRVYRQPEALLANLSVWAINDKGETIQGTNTSEANGNTFLEIKGLEPATHYIITIKADSEKYIGEISIDTSTSALQKSE